MSYRLITTSVADRHDNGDCDGPGLFGCPLCNDEVVPGVCFDCGDVLDPWGVCDACAADMARAKAAHPSNYRPEVGSGARFRELVAEFGEAMPSDFEPEVWPADLCRTCGGPAPCQFHGLRVVS